MEKILIGLAIVFGMAVSCTDGKEVLPEMLGKPENLKATRITMSGAILEWDEVSGAESYNVNIEGLDPVSVPANTYSVEGLSPETEYTWSVQAINAETESEWSESSSFITSDAPMGVPSNLRALETGRDYARLSWDAVEGAVGYEINVDGFDLVEVEADEYRIDGLSPDTEYMWQCRALGDGKVGSWSAMSSFVTEAIPVLEVAFTSAAGTDNGTALSDNTTNFLLDFYSYDPETEDGDGWHFVVDAASPAVDRDKFLQYLNIPNGDYRVGVTAEPYTILDSNTGKTKLERLEAGKVTGSYEITEGTMNVTGTGDGYTVVIEVMYGEDIFIGTYIGSLVIANGNYDSTVKNMGTFNISTVEYLPASYGGGSVDAYLLKVDGEGLLGGDGGPVGSGWSISGIQFHVPAGDEGAIPEGTYNITADNAENTVRSGYVDYTLYPDHQQGFQIIRMSDNAYYAIDNGTVTVSYVDGKYEISIDANVAYGGGNYVGVITGDLP